MHGCCNMMKHSIITNVMAVCNKTPAVYMSIHGFDLGSGLQMHVCRCWSMIAANGHLHIGSCTNWWGFEGHPPVQFQCICNYSYVCDVHSISPLVMQSQVMAELDPARSYRCNSSFWCTVLDQYVIVQGLESARHLQSADATLISPLEW